MAGRSSFRALFGCGALALAFAVTPSSQAATVAPTADWQLQGNRTSAVSGAPALTNIGTGNTFVTTTVDSTTNRLVLKYPKGNGLQVSPLTGLTGTTQYSVVLLYRPVTLTGYQRLLDFNDGAGDTGLYQLNDGLSAYPSANGGAGKISATSFNQVVLTRTTGKLVTAYINGVQALQFTDSSDAWTIAKTSVRFFKDNTTSGATGEEGAGQAARIRLYKVALTSAQVSGLDRLPPNTADLGVKLVDAPDPVLHGAYLAYTATVTNNGPAAAAGVSASVTYPSGATFVASSPSAGTCAAPVSRKVVCSVGTLGIGASATVLIVVTAPTTTGTITASSTVTATTADPASSNNAASTTTTVR